MMTSKTLVALVQCTKKKATWWYQFDRFEKGIRFGWLCSFEMGKNDWKNTLSRKHPIHVKAIDLSIIYSTEQQEKSPAANSLLTSQPSLGCRKTPRSKEITITFLVAARSAKMTHSGRKPSSHQMRQRASASSHFVFVPYAQ